MLIFMGTNNINSILFNSLHGTTACGDVIAYGELYDPKIDDSRAIRVITLGIVINCKLNEKKEK